MVKVSRFREKHSGFSEFIQACKVKSSPFREPCRVSCCACGRLERPHHDAHAPVRQGHRRRVPVPSVVQSKHLREIENRRIVHLPARFVGVGRLRRVVDEEVDTGVAFRAGRGGPLALRRAAGRGGPRGRARDRRRGRAGATGRAGLAWLAAPLGPPAVGLWQAQPSPKLSGTVL